MSLIVGIFLSMFAAAGMVSLITYDTYYRQEQKRRKDVSRWINELIEKKEKWKKKEDYWAYESDGYSFTMRHARFSKKSLLLHCEKNGRIVFKWLYREGSIEKGDQIFLHGIGLSAESKLMRRRYDNRKKQYKELMRDLYLLYIKPQEEKEKDNAFKKKNVEKTIYFAGIQEKINKLVEQKEWLQEEELHKLTHTYPSDLRSIESVLIEIAQTSTEKAKELKIEAAKVVETELEKIRLEIEQRQIKKAQEKIEVIKIR